MIMQGQYSQNKLKYPLDGLKVNELREEAFKNFSLVGLPTKNDEAWKFTSLNEFKDIQWNVPFEEKFLTHDQMSYVSKYLPSDFHNLVFINGSLNKTLSDIDVVLCDEDIAVDDLKINENDPDYKLTQLSRSFAHHKKTLIIDKNTKLSKPVQIMNICSGDVSFLIQPIFNIKVSDDCELKLIHHVLGLQNYASKTQALNIDLLIDVGARANVKFVNIENSLNKDFCFERIKINLQNNSTITSLDLGLGSKVARHYLEVKFNGENSDAGVFGLSLLADTQHCDHYTFIQHVKGNNQSVQHYKSILTDKSRSVFRGRVRIEPNAQKANSEQLNNNLLISRAALVDSVPQLEIYADDVKAGHGSTVGQLNKEEIFYFLSRGISERQAVQMLSYGYAKELVYKLDNDIIQNFVFQILDEKLSDIF